MSDSTSINISNLKKGVNFGGYKQGESIKIDKGFIEIVKHAANSDGNKANLSDSEIEIAYKQLVDAGYIKESANTKQEYISKFKDAALNSANLKSSKTDKKTGITTNTYQIDDQKWTQQLDKNGREIGGKYADGTVYTTTYDEKNNTRTRTFVKNDINHMEIYDLNTNKIIEKKENGATICTYQYNEDGSFVKANKDNSTELYNQNGEIVESRYPNGNVKARYNYDGILYLEYHENGVKSKELIKSEYGIVGTYVMDGKEANQYGPKYVYRLYDQQGQQKGFEESHRVDYTESFDE